MKKHAMAAADNMVQARARRRNTTTCVMAGLVLIGGAAVHASGDVLLSVDNNTFSDASLDQSDLDFNQVGNPQFVSAEGSPGLDFSGSASASYNDMGLVGTADSRWERAYSPSNPGLGNPFSAILWSGTAAAESTSQGNWRDSSFGNGATLTGFSVASDTPWSFMADNRGDHLGIRQRQLLRQLFLRHR